MPSFSINRVVLIGRLTHDPELRSLPSGTSVCRLRVACNSSRKERGEYRERASFFDVSAFAGAADSAGRYLHKGSRVAIDGRLDWREWETADQQKRQAVKILADTVLFLDGPSDRRPGGERPSGEHADSKRAGEHAADEHERGGHVDGGHEDGGHEDGGHESGGHEYGEHEDGEREDGLAQFQRSAPGTDMELVF